MHSVNVDRLPSFRATYSCVSSAYCVWATPKELITPPTADVYKYLGNESR